MIVIKVPENDNMLQKDINLQKKMMNILLSTCKQFYNDKCYYVLYDFKNICTNVINTINELIDHLINNDIFNIKNVKLNCVVAITNENDMYYTGDYCYDKSINLTLTQLLYFFLNSIVIDIIDCCMTILYNMNTENNINIDTVQQCINEIKCTLQHINNIELQTLHPICKKFNYSAIDDIIHSYIAPLLKQIK